MKKAGKKSSQVKKPSNAKKTPSKKRKVSAIPKGYHSITPYLIVSDAHRAIEFYIKIFGAKLTLRMDAPNGKISHAELKIGDSNLMLADEHPEINALSPERIGGSSVNIHLYIKDVDAIVKRAVAAGAVVQKPVADMFYGDRNGSIQDPFGHVWYVSTHIEDVTPAQAKKRMQAATS